MHFTNTFHVAVRLFSNRSQMTSKWGKNKKVAHEAITECVTESKSKIVRILTYALFGGTSYTIFLFCPLFTRWIGKHSVQSKTMIGSHAIDVKYKSSSILCRSPISYATDLWIVSSLTVYVVVVGHRHPWSMLLARFSISTSAYLYGSAVPMIMVLG